MLKIWSEGFELEEKLDQYFDGKFEEYSEFDSFGAEKLSRDPLQGPKMKMFNFEVEETLDLYFKWLT